MASEPKTSIDLEDSTTTSTSYETQGFLNPDAPQKSPSRLRRLAPWLWKAAFLVLASGWLVPILGAPGSAVSSGSSSWDRPRKTPLPPEVFERVQKTFMPDTRYIGPSNSTHHQWDHLVAAHDALYIPDGEKYGLPNGTFPSFDHPGKIGNGPAAFYVITALHQLHCLNIIRFHYWQVKGVTPSTEGYSDAAWDVHIDHCFEYLRQAISCGSAFEIEGASPLADPGEDGHIASTVTGWGVEHTCINFEALRTFQINQEKLYNATWREHE